jgi:hypothetical protein
LISDVTILHLFHHPRNLIILSSPLCVRPGPFLSNDAALMPGIKLQEKGERCQYGSYTYSVSLIRKTLQHLRHGSAQHNLVQNAKRWEKSTVLASISFWCDPILAGCRSETVRHGDVRPPPLAAAGWRYAPEAPRGDVGHDSPAQRSHHGGAARPQRPLLLAAHL